MKPRSIATIRKEIAFMQKEELVNLCLHLAKFSTENKELLTFLIFYADLEDDFLADLIAEMDDTFRSVSPRNSYLAKKTFRKMIRLIKKYSHYSNSKHMEIELRLHFCEKFKLLGFLKSNDQPLLNIFGNEVSKIKKLISSVHEDLQYDYTKNLDEIQDQ